MNVPGYLERMLRLAHQCEVREQLDWTLNLGGDEIIFVVECADLFLENEYETVPVLPEDVDAFERALTDVGAVTDGDYTFGPPLYACRLRRRRPHNMGYPTDSRVHFLFNSAGPDRTVEPEHDGRHAVIEVPASETRQFVFPADRFASHSPLPEGPLRPHIPGAQPPSVVVVAEEPTAELKVDGQVLTAGDGWPELIVGTVEPPPHPCAPHGTGGPDHCGLCGRTFTPKEMELAGKGGDV